MINRFIFFTFCLAILGCNPEATHSKELQAFADSFATANHSRNIQPMLELYELEGSAEQTINMLKNALLYELNMPIKSIEFEPLSGSPEESIEYEHQGIPYGPTLEPSLRMRVRYATEDNFESLFTIGQNSAGEWRIVSSRPLPVSAH